MQHSSEAPARPLRCRGASPRPGFTLLEVMIAVAVVAILAAIAYPGFQSQVRKARRSDAIAAIGAVQQAEERWRASHPSYTGTLGAGGLNVQTLSREGYYTLAITGHTATTYTVTATAVSDKSQARDAGCTSMVMTVANGNGTPTPPACWSR